MDKSILGKLKDAREDHKPAIASVFNDGRVTRDDVATARGAKSCITLEEREKKYRELTQRWLKKNNVKYTGLIFGKMNADYYVDDKNISIEEFINFEE